MTITYIYPLLRVEMLLLNKSTAFAWMRILICSLNSIGKLSTLHAFQFYLRETYFFLYLQYLGLSRC